MLPAEVHISSLIVQAMPDTMPAVTASVSAMPGLEIHAVSEGKMVVVLETADEGEIVARLSEINLLDGVMSVNLVYHQVDQAEESAETGEG
jgi:periplasmic nitrate reductase NapD